MKLQRNVVQLAKDGLLCHTTTRLGYGTGSFPNLSYGRISIVGIRQPHLTYTVDSSLAQVFARLNLASYMPEESHQTWISPGVNSTYNYYSSGCLTIRYSFMMEEAQQARLKPCMKNKSMGRPYNDGVAGCEDRSVNLNFLIHPPSAGLRYMPFEVSDILAQARRDNNDVHNKYPTNSRNRTHRKP